MNKAEIKTDEQTKSDILFVNDAPQFCAYKTPIPMASQLGGTTIFSMPCNTNCPLMKIENKIVSLYCGCERVQYTLETPKN